ncbi:tRNA lysidine(34) synthetase TilS [Foetidibacter luteolus]|uniref:tRNA lysidine(34) synthetase TilS n=1 Tax=Foetidibacter luteolus TaxID=2608880 RepID=UPI00129AF946|nr:tRNA lysidine(34) synthetase TilS [Foetidibacter luteolus]
MNLLEHFRYHIQQNFPQLSACTGRLVIAVSGGIDSIVLTDLLAKAGFDFAIAHCNFKLRGEESERDEQFVRSLGLKYNSEVLVKSFNTAEYAAEKKLSIQEAARELRYNWFSQLVDKDSYLLTAHHADDNIETLLMHFFRGTGIQGLAGIPAYSREKRIIRPLLFAYREDVTAYANENQLQWVEDSSNASDKYTRNFFRNQLLPAIEEVYPQARKNLQDNIERFKETALLYNQSVSVHKQKLIEIKGNELHIPVLKLQQTAALKTIVWEIIKDYGFTVHQTDEIVKLLSADNGSYVQSHAYRTIRNRQWLIIAPLETTEAATILVEPSDRKIVFDNNCLTVETVDAATYQLSTAASVASLDAGLVKFPLLLRKWKQGDYFYPLGMRKKKKLSRFFIDLKLSTTDKEKVWVLECDKKILWVVGYRIDDRFKLSAGTKRVLKLKID